MKMKKKVEMHTVKCAGIWTQLRSVNEIVKRIVSSDRKTNFICNSAQYTLINMRENKTTEEKNVCIGDDIQKK